MNCRHKKSCKNVSVKIKYKGSVVFDWSFFFTEFWSGGPRLAFLSFGNFLWVFNPNIDFVIVDSQIIRSQRMGLFHICNVVRILQMRVA